MASQAMDMGHETVMRRDSDLIMTTKSDFMLPSISFQESLKSAIPNMSASLNAPRAQHVTSFSSLPRAPDPLPYRKVSISDLLNSPSPVLHPMWQLPSIQVDPSFTRAQERYHLLHSLYHVCQNASDTYVRYVLPQPRPRPRYWQPNFCPYNSFPPPKDPSLMDNISTICTYIWRKARSDLMAPHRAEADAVKHMLDLYAWGETIVKGVEGNWVSGEDSENGSLLECAGSGEITKFGNAAKKLCEWFGDAEAWKCCVEIVDEIEELENHDDSQGVSCDWGSEDTLVGGV